MTHRRRFLRLGLLFALSAILLAAIVRAIWGAGAAASELQPKRLAIMVKNHAGPATTLWTSPGPRAVAERLRELDYAFVRPQLGGKCATERDSPELDFAQFETVLTCLNTVAAKAEIVILYYSGPVSAIAGANYILPSGVSSAGANEHRLAVADLLRSPAPESSFVSAVIIDSPEPPSSDPALRAQHKFMRVETPGKRRILAYSAPVGEVSESTTLWKANYPSRLLTALDAEVAKSRRGEPLTDLRDLLRNRDLVTSKAWPGRTSEVVIEGLSAEPITLVGRSKSLQVADKGPPRQDGVPGQLSNCRAAYRQVITRAMSCRGMFDFQKACRDSYQAAVVTTALRLRCADELLEQKYKEMQESFAKAEQQRSCSTMSGFVEKYAIDFELADAPEMEKANGLRTRLCEQEERERELAALENGLRGALAENDCAAFKRYEKQSGLRLSADQANRLTSAMKRRCDIEEKAAATLRTCLDQMEKVGNFCGGAACFSAFRSILPQDAYFTPYRPESQRQERICKEYTSMRSCFAGDDCGGERCSLPLRLAVGNGPLITHIQKNEQEAGLKCAVKREREQQAKREAEREQQRRAEEARLQLRRAVTIRLSLCNRSDHPKIWVALSYYDYDEGNWVREGWWTVSSGNCEYIGDRFRRGTIYFYAHTAGEKLVWAGNFGICVDWNRFHRVNSGNYRCDASHHRKFRERQIDDGEY